MLPKSAGWAGRQSSPSPKSSCLLSCDGYVTKWPLCYNRKKHHSQVRTIDKRQHRRKQIHDIVLWKIAFKIQEYSRQFCGSTIILNEGFSIYNMSQLALKSFRRIVLNLLVLFVRIRSKSYFCILISEKIMLSSNNCEEEKTIIMFVTIYFQVIFFSWTYWGFLEGKFSLGTAILVFWGKLQWHVQRFIYRKGKVHKNVFINFLIVIFEEHLRRLIS